jgi:hypothetical protein
MRHADVLIAVTTDTLVTYWTGYRNKVYSQSNR